MRQGVEATFKPDLRHVVRTADEEFAGVSHPQILQVFHERFAGFPLKITRKGGGIHGNHVGNFVQSKRMSVMLPEVCKDFVQTPVGKSGQFVTVI
jgi:hypothetical protein